MAADERTELDPAELGRLRFPRAVWNVRTSPLVVLTIIIPPLVALLLVPGLRTAEGLATATQFVVSPTVLIAALLLYVQFRVTGSTVMAWCTVCLTVYAVQSVMLAGLRAGEPGPFFQRPGRVLIVDLPVAALMLLVLRRSHRWELPIDPLGTGLLVGVVVASINMVLNHVAPRLSMTSPPLIVVEVLFAVTGTAIGVTAYRLVGFPRWFLLRLGLGAVALVVNRLALCQRDQVVLDSVATVTGVAGASFMLIAAAAGLRYSLVEHRQSLVSLTRQVAAMEAEERASRARLHEITNSISSIAVASSLLHHAEEVSPAKRAKLERMLEAEAGRLARVLTSAGGALELTDDGGPERPTPQEPIDLDDVIEPLVISHQALRRRVEWQPSGLRAVGDSDAVAEALNILLDNAARHAPDARTLVQVGRRGDTVEIVVHDDGPGIPEDVRGTLFEWGRPGPNSKGQGIGLHLAHQLMSSGGNSLRLEAEGGGTRFVIGLPAAGSEAS